MSAVSAPRRKGTVVQGAPSLAAVRRVRRVASSLASVKRLVVLAVLVLVVAPSLLATWVAPYDPLVPDILHRFAPPGLSHPFGTDVLGRDLFTRCLYGTRLSLLSAGAVIGLALAIGVPLGMVAAFYGGTVDTVLMRITDVFLAFPSLILAMAVAAALGTSLQNAIIALAVVSWPSFARVARGQILAVKQNLFVESARASGAGSTRIMRVHILPNSIQPIVVLAALDVSGTIIAVAGLSFIGLGAHPPAAELGVIIGEGQAQLLNFPWVAIAPGAVMFSIALGANLLADVVQEILDPRR